jgi:hypothetical protein
MATINLGEEWRDDLLIATNATLRAMGGRQQSNRWGVGGSQAVDTTQWRIGWRTVKVESETYVGLMISGHAALVRQIAQGVAARCGGSR